MNWGEEKLKRGKKRNVGGFREREDVEKES
jgi:hypothetical protein